MSLRDLLAPGKSLIAPGVFDMISARHMTGYGTVAASLGPPDVERAMRGVGTCRRRASRN